MPSNARPSSAAPYEPLTLTQYGLRALLLGAMALAFVTAMLTPAVGGIGDLPGHVLDKLRDNRPPRHTPPPVNPEIVYTKAQKAAFRRTASFVAAREVGVHEWPSRDNRGARIITYRRAVTGPGENPRVPEAWCADFVSWVWKRAGVSIGFGGRGSDSVAELAGWARLTHRWHNARGTYHPIKGDLVVYSSYSHIGMVAKTAHGRIKTIEGNFKDAVSVRYLSGRDGDIVGYIRPV